MFEDDEILNVCSFCGKEINMFPASSSDGKFKFCDLICAKLFYDNNEKFVLDIKRYNNYFNEGQLSDKASRIYEQCRFMMFEQLPVYVPVQTDPAFNNPHLMKKVYNSVLSPVLFKSIGAYE